MERLFVYNFDPKKAGICVAELNDNFLSKGFRIHTVQPYETIFLIFLIKEHETWNPQNANQNKNDSSKQS